MMEFSTIFDLNSIPALSSTQRHHCLSLQSLNAQMSPILQVKTPSESAALWGLTLLWHDHWDLAHQSVQRFEGNADCDLVHGIIHRREGDFENSKYWFQQVANHQAFDRIATTLQEYLPQFPFLSKFLASNHWNPIQFLKSVIQNPENEDLKKMQSLEMMAIAKHWWPISKEPSAQT